MKYIIDIPNEMVIESPLKGLTLGIAMIETSTQKHFIVPTNIPLMPYIEPQKWIPCNEITGKGFPKEDGNYYITEQNYGYYLEPDEKQCVTHISPFRKGDFTNRFYDSNHSNIVAWMPLPEPYKEEEE